MQFGVFLLLYMFKKVLMMDLHIHSNDNQVLPTSHVLANISGVKDLIAATIPFQRLLFCFFFDYKMCIFTHPTKNSNGFMSGLLDGRRIGLDLPIHSFLNQKFKAKRTWSLLYYRWRTVLLKEKLYCNSLSASIFSNRGITKIQNVSVKINIVHSTKL